MVVAALVAAEAEVPLNTPPSAPPGGACDVKQLMPCLNAFTSKAAPSPECCKKLKEQESCFCKYMKDPNLQNKKVGYTVIYRSINSFHQPNGGSHGGGGGGGAGGRRGGGSAKHGPASGGGLRRVALLPCLPAFTSTVSPPPECCKELKEQEPCYCKYMKDPNLQKYLDSPNGKNVAKACTLTIPKC
ncbi:hypothetical protein DM860_010295 [Cuscuta australis]|uniref:Bifunctional inhibitor/plant lipid transfer protein/seed storage helical domain-containing protein n=1 Tax=Cuscuta australis TaxID=267555 RepID=A0A328DB21_9ASTE|nr:hypothetical protein DM860_010295 [Cuscuta australis]